MPDYIVKHTPDFTVDADASKPVWQQAPVIAIDNFSWYTAGDKQATEARLLYSDTGLYALFVCEDKHISAAVTTINGSVCRDSCVELFATVDPAQGPGYFNLEMNCCGVLHLGFGPERRVRTLIDDATAHGIVIATTVPGPTKADSPDDDGWALEVKLPFATLEAFAGYRFGGPGTVWNANLYRCGGTDQQHSTAFPIGLPKPDFHRPEFFRPILFE